jgi:siroheme synthase
MGMKALPHFTQTLIKHGMDAQTPAAVIPNGTTSQQRIVTATLATIATEALAAGLSAPALTIIGTVVTIRDTLMQFSQTLSEAR